MLFYVFTLKFLRSLLPLLLPTHLRLIIFHLWFLHGRKSCISKRTRSPSFRTLLPLDLEDIIHLKLLLIHIPIRFHIRFEGFLLIWSQRIHLHYFLNLFQLFLNSVFEVIHVISHVRFFIHAVFKWWISLERRRLPHHRMRQRPNTASKSHSSLRLRRWLVAKDCILHAWTLVLMAAIGEIHLMTIDFQIC